MGVLPSLLPSPSVIRPRTARDTTAVIHHVKSSVSSSNSEVVRRVALAARREARRVATTVAVKKSAKKFAPVTVPFTLDRKLLPRRAATSTPLTLLPRAAITGSPKITTTGKLYLPVE